MNHRFVRYVIAGDIQREWVFLRDGKYISDRLGGNLVYALCGAALWDQRIGLLTKIGNELSEEHSTWLQEYAVLDGIIISKNAKTKCQLLNYEFLPENDINPINLFSRKGIRFPRELLGIKNVYDENSLFLKEPPFFESDIPTNYKYCSILLIEKLSVEVQNTLPMLFRRFSSPYVIVNPSLKIFESGYKKSLYSFFSGVKCLIIQEHELQKIFNNGSKKLSYLVEKITSFGIETVIIKLIGGNYLSFDSISKACRLIESYKTAQVDLTGVDSAFDGGFIAGMQKTFDPEISAAYGSVSASVCQENKSPGDMLLINKKLLDERLLYLQKRIRDYPL